MSKYSYVTYKITETTHGDVMLIRCDLSRAECQVQVNYLENGWEGTQYQSGNAKCSRGELVGLGESILADAMNDSGAEGEYEFESEIIEGRYKAEIDNGEGGTEYFDADDMIDAMKMARKWAMAGEWEEDGEVILRVFDLATGKSKREYVQVEANSATHGN